MNWHLSVDMTHMIFILMIALITTITLYVQENVLYGVGLLHLQLQAALPPKVITLIALTTLYDNLISQGYVTN